MIRGILKKAFGQKKLIGVTTKEIEWEESSIGFITEMNDDSFILDEIDAFGMHEGKTVIDINEVIYVTVDSWYLLKLQQVYENKALFDPSKGVRIWKEGEAIIPYLKELRDTRKITRFYFKNDHHSDINYVIGIVLDFDDRYMLLKDIGEDGLIEGYSCYRIQDVVRLRYDDLAEQKIDFLLHNQLSPFYADDENMLRK